MGNPVNVNTSAIDILCETETLSEEAMKKVFTLLPVTNGATRCLSNIFEEQHRLIRSPVCRGLLETAKRALHDFRVETNVAYEPFEIFWDNPDEPKHSRLLQYFINPREEHGCGLFMLCAFLKTLKIGEGKLLVDENCEVTREDKHIDLLVKREGDDGKYAIIIENKVNGARDQETQLQTYYNAARRMGFEDEEIFLCYLTLRGGEPGAGSLGSLEKKRVTLATFEARILPWLEGVLRDKENIPDGMCDNLKHYRDLIKWRLNKEKIMKMNDRIFEALQKADKENQLPKFEDITALEESAQVLKSCYRRLMNAKTISEVWRILQDRDKLKASHAYHDDYTDANKWYDDLQSSDYYFGFSIGDVVIVGVGEDKDGVFTGYCKKPEGNGQDVKRFDEFVRKQAPSVFDGKSNAYWYSFNKYKQGDAIQPEDATRLTDTVLDMYRKMERLVAKFQGAPTPQR